MASVDVPFESRPLLGGLELGGTKCSCLIGTGPDDVRMHATIPTGADPAATVARLEAELNRGIEAHGSIRALGVASFGPIDRCPTSPRYGWITSTPKPGWRDTPLVPRLAHLSIPVGFDTDVNGAALAEGRWGAAQALEDFAYVTVGTGVGVGLFAHGALIHGFLHPELGHIRVARRAGDTWPGVCSFHGDCVEGLASGPAIAARAGAPAHLVAPTDAVWHTVVHALAQLLHTLVLATAPRRIIMGGGVIEARPELLVRLRRELVSSLNGYVLNEALDVGINDYVTSPGLGSRAGALGALALAADAIDSPRPDGLFAR
ncbi:MAG: ROK family protein [Steroidobacteraceae bacterium]|jgi:fructokinase